MQRKLTTSQQAAINQEVDRFRDDQVEILTRNAAAAHIAGDMRAQQALNIKLSFDVINQEAAKYAQKYKQLLINRGGCMIQGEFKPWLKDRTEEDRSEIARIIQQGYLQGTQTGVKAGVLGGYPKGSIADQLSDYFNARKSHASMVARTEIARIQHAGSMTRYKKQEVKKGLWLVFEPCPICEAYNRHVYELDQLPAEIPVHPHCRCALAPVPDDIPNGPAPTQPVPAVFEETAKVMPAKPKSTSKIKSPAEIRADLPNATKRWEAACRIKAEEHEAVADEVGQLYEEYNERQSTMLWALEKKRITQDSPEHKKYITELEEINKAIDQAEAKRRKLAEEFNILKSSEKQYVREVLYLDPDDTKLEFKINKGWDYFGTDEKAAGRVAREDRMHGVDEFLNRITAPSVKKGINTVKIDIVNRRSFTRDDGKFTIFIDATASPTDTEWHVVHETGHLIEFSNKDFETSAYNFREYRTRGEKLQKINDIDQTKRFNDNEMARRDRFITTYVGKDYGDRSTELISSGVQFLWQDPVGFASKDPEMFDWIINLLRGEPQLEFNY